MIVAGVVLLAVLTAGLAAMFLAFFVWRDGFRRGWRRARHSPPLCPGCGYNLSGLRECRCPECGVNYTLDELWRSPVLGRASRAHQQVENRGA